MSYSQINMAIKTELNQKTYWTNACAPADTKKVINIRAGYHRNHRALRTAKTLWSFGRSECNRVTTIL